MQAPTGRMRTGVTNKWKVSCDGNTQPRQRRASARTGPHMREPIRSTWDDTVSGADTPRMTSRMQTEARTTSHLLLGRHLDGDWWVDGVVADGGENDERIFRVFIEIAMMCCGASGV